MGLGNAHYRGPRRVLHETGGEFTEVATPRTFDGAAANMKNDAAENANADVVFAAGGASVRHVISGVAWSYRGSAPVGKIQVLDGATVIFDLDVTATGPGFIPFPSPLKGTANTSLTIRAAAGGAGTFAKSNALGHWTE